MKVLHLHIGSPKTGSTSIQEIFSHNRKALYEQGFIYPGNSTDHHFLYFASKAPRNKWPRHFKGMDPQELKAYLQRYFSDLEEDFKKRENVVMSTEYIFLDEKRFVENIIGYLRQFFSKIEVSCFLREPVDYYKSFQQQLIKGQSYIESPHSFKYEFKKVIGTWAPLCDDFEVLDFSKSQNSFKRLCERIGISTEQLSNLDYRSKGSVSIEQMLLMEKVYKEIYSEYDDQLSGKLHVKALTRFNASFTTKPKLQGWVKKVVTQNHINDLIWLKESYGVDFLSAKVENKKNTSPTTFKNGRTTVREVYEVPSEKTVKRYEASVVDALLKKLTHT